MEGLFCCFQHSTAHIYIDSEGAQQHTGVIRTLGMGKGVSLESGARKGGLVYTVPYRTKAQHMIHHLSHKPQTDK